jgi:subtilisin family serine protease
MDAAAPSRRLRRLRRVALIVAVAAPLAATATADAPVADPLRELQWALDAIHAPSAPTGAGALVAVVDSGVDAAHPELAGRVVAGPDLVDGDDSPDDGSGHGTHVAGIIAAASGNGLGGAGVAPGARILAVRVLGPDDRGNAATIAAGVDAAVDAGADVVNLSMTWAEPGAHIAPVTAAIGRAADAGVLVVVAAGNDARERCDEPVLPRRALCVGSLSYARRLARSSNHGHGLGIVAPGEDLLSTWPGGGYRSMSGTSQAAAVTSGVAALLVELGLRGQELMDRLIATARDIGPLGRRAHAHPGAGSLDAERAVDGARQRRLPAVLRVASPRRAAAAVVGGRGLLVSCDSARPGLCRVGVRVHGTVVARGQATVDGTDVFDVLARPTPAGRRLLAGTHTVEAVVETTLAGAPTVRRRLLLLHPRASTLTSR